MEYASFDNSKSLYTTVQGRHNGYEILCKLLSFSKKMYRTTQARYNNYECVRK